MIPMSKTNDFEKPDVQRGSVTFQEYTMPRDPDQAPSHCPCTVSTREGRLMYPRAPTIHIPLSYRTRGLVTIFKAIWTGGFLSHNFDLRPLRRDCRLGLELEVHNASVCCLPRQCQSSEASLLLGRCWVASINASSTSSPRSENHIRILESLSEIVIQFLRFW